MAIEPITCPNCGAAGIQVDTALEYGKCGYCDSALRIREILHLDTKSLLLEKLRRNAQRSFELRQYGNAKTDWERALQIDCTDHACHWGIARCFMALQPCSYTSQDTACAKALAYAPPETRAGYERRMKAHDAGARAIEQERLTRRRSIKRLENWRFFLRLVGASSVMSNIVAVFIYLALDLPGFTTYLSFTLVLGAVAFVGWKAADRPRKRMLREEMEDRR